MIIAPMLKPDDSPHYGIARAEYDEKHGYGRRDLQRLYKRAMKDLEVKEAFFKDKEEKKDERDKV